MAYALKNPITLYIFDFFFSCISHYFLGSLSVFVNRSRKESVLFSECRSLVMALASIIVEAPVGYVFVGRSAYPENDIAFTSVAI